MAVFIGISGGSGSGKSTFAGELQALLPGSRTVCSDRFFKDPLPTMISPLDGQAYPDYNHPDSVDRAAFAAELERLSKEPGFVLVEGAYIFCIPEILEKLDYRIYIDAAIETRFFRRIRRNLQKGQDLDFIGGYYLKCARFREKEYSLPSRSLADLTVDNEYGFVPPPAETAALIRERFAAES